MLFDVEIRSLSANFYNDYPASKYPEILSKSGRPYTCLLIEVSDSYLICVPFRTNIRHKEAFLFSGTNRSLRNRSGLDYSKCVLIKNSLYIDTKNTIVDSDEYKVVMKNINRIVEEVENYIDTYIKHIKGEVILHEKEYKRRYSYATLPYFHDILGI